ncbi:MAG TPA: SIS domain-containing protein [Armatimonadota bacterium]|nr:SIS domain-containing protein [Armatimonadota bacterium]
MMLSPFLREIDEQPAALHDLVAYYRGADGQHRLGGWGEWARARGQVTFIGSGTSEHTPHVALGAMAEAGVHADALDAGELLHYPRPLRGVALVSQSGESVEIRRLAERYAGTPFVAITNHAESTLARAARIVLPLCGGVEETITTKTYSNSLALFALLARMLDGVDAARALLDELDAVSRVLGAVDAEGIERAADLLADARALHVIARGPSVAGARQAALTFMEGTRISATAFPAGSFRHGPFELADDAHRCLIYLPASGRTHGLLAGLAAELADKGSRVIVFTDGALDLPAATCQLLRVPAVSEPLFPLAAAITQERLLAALARRRGLVAGAFRYGGKVTTVE